MGKCFDLGIHLSFYPPLGKYLASVADTTNGNVYLRRTQYRIADDASMSLKTAKSFIYGKLYNSKYVLLRCARDHKMRVNDSKQKRAAANITSYMNDAVDAPNKDSLRGIEGNAAAEYFQVFNDMILQEKEEFYFKGRTKRPPLDRVNALLSFAYSLLANDCAAALHGVGLDPYVGFMHVDRPGRKSLALDIEEELRVPYADRFVLTLINNRMISSDSILAMDNGTFVLDDKSRKVFLTEWQKRKKQEIAHPFLKEKVSWGLVPHIQALLLAKSIRGDLDGYPPFFWK